MVVVELGDHFRCPCGTNIEVNGAYLAAHWSEKADDELPEV